MPERSTLVGRDGARARLEEALQRARLGEGSFVLLSGEAGVGKTRLAAEVAAGADALVLAGTSSHGGTAPYGPVVTALRSHLRAVPGGLDECGPLRPHLALILPELGDPAPATDRATLFEAVRCAFAHLARETPALVVLDDLQWSDEATLELLSALAATVQDLSLLLIGAYRSDGLPRQHGLRRLRNELRRAGRLDELTLEPLGLDETGELVKHLLGDTPAPSLVQAIHDRTQGVPFFVEELSSALQVGGRLKAGRRGLEIAGEGEVPLPETIRDAVAIGTAELSDEARAAAEVAAVAGESFSTGGRRGALRRGGPRGVAGARAGARARRRPRGLSPRAHARGRLRGGAVDAPPRAAPRSWRRRWRRRAPRARRSRRTGWARARTSARWRRWCRRRRSPRSCTPIATPRRRAARRWSCGRSAATTPAATRRSSATRAAASCRATCPRPRAGGGSWRRSAARSASRWRWPMPSAGWPRSTS